MNFILKIINWVGILCEIYLFFKLIKLGMPIMEKEVKRFLRKF